MKAHVFHPEADTEYAHAAAYYTELSAGLGGRFYDEIERVISEIANAPHRFRQYDPPPAAIWHETSLTPWSISKNRNGYGSSQSCPCAANPITGSTVWSDAG